jgi:transcriptional regulator with XRE-family HTH domain
MAPAPGLTDSPPMATEPSPTVRRRRLGLELRRLREAASLRIEDVAAHMECSTSKISRLETGRARTVAVRDVRDLLDLYQLEDQEQRELLLGIARDAKEQRGWWTDYEDVLPARLETYVGLEAEATSVRAYEAQLVAGLLQTEDYARAVLKADRFNDSPANIERLVDLRMRRQEVLTREQPLEFWDVLDEAVLRRAIGGPQVMADQLRRLLELAEQPHITLQVLPFAAGAHAGVSGSFALIEFPGADPDVVYVDSAAGNIYIERPREVRTYSLKFDHLRATALSPDESTAFIRAVVAQESR